MFKQHEDEHKDWKYSTLEEKLFLSTKYIKHREGRQICILLDVILISNVLYSWWLFNFPENMSVTQLAWREIKVVYSR